ncbi:(2Fe-2S)-binding protein [Streptomyces sp. NPDC057197]|uniref:(2Fe-2S)-binding protein n=1 Tax=Streptomyces sp. NPDC057197 TaxID=3346045 RepID=UPI00363A6852
MTHRMTFRGVAVPAEPGQSIAAALVAAGITDWRTTRGRGRPRGLFCGIGVCFDCLISIDGARAERACLVPAADGMRLEDALEPGGTPEDDGDPEPGHARHTEAAGHTAAAGHTEEEGDGAPS